MVSAARWTAAAAAMALFAVPGAPAWSDDGAAAIVSDLGVREAGRVVSVVETPTGPAIEVAVVSGRADALDAVAGQLADPDVTSVELDSRVHASVVSEPFLPDQWGIGAVKASATWSVTKGAGVTVAVVDTGVDARHEDLAGQVLTGVDLSGRTPVVGGGIDPNGHGTHVAGIIAAADNGVGGVGVAPEAKILPVRVLDEDGAGYASDVAEGIIYAVDNGATVINLSLGGPVLSAAQEAAIQYAAKKGVTVLAAAGNSGPGAAPEYPAALPTVIAVAATTPDDAVASFSTRGSYVDVAAPGTMILSSLPGNEYAYESGTSMATPFAAGVAALVRAVDVTRQVDVLGLLTGTAKDIDAAGVDTASGSGLICASCAIAARTGAVIPDDQGAEPAPSASAAASWGVVRVRADRGERVVLRAPRTFSKCTWSVRRPAGAWRDLPKASCKLVVGKVKASMTGTRYRVDAAVAGDPVYMAAKLRVR